MEVNNIVADVSSILQDNDGYPSTWIIKKINEALNLIAAMYRIPDLQVFSSVSAAIASVSVAMPSTYLKELYLATTTTYPRGVFIYPNLKQLKQNSDADEEGPIRIVVVDKTTLHYRPKPLEAESILLHYYGRPEELVAGDEFPTYIPDILQKEIFTSYPLKEAYLQIEDGIDGAAFNTQKYGSLAASAIMALARFYPHAPKAKPELIRGGSFY